MTNRERDHVKSHIELAIERARDGVSDSIDELDRKMRDTLNFKQIASDHAWQLVGVGAAFGFLVGVGVPKVLVRTIQLGVPLALAVQIVRKRQKRSALPPIEETGEWT